MPQRNASFGVANAMSYVPSALCCGSPGACGWLFASRGRRGLTRKTRDFSPERGSVWGSGCACRSSKSEGVLHPRGAALRLARLKPLPTAEHFPSRFAHQKTYHQTLTPPPSGAAPAVRTHSPVALPRSRGDRDGKGLLERSQFACLTGVFVLFMFFSAHAALAARNLTIE